MRSVIRKIGYAVSGIVVLAAAAVVAGNDRPSAGNSTSSPAEAAAQVDRLIESELQKARVEIAPICSDADFLRRLSLDLTGTPPTPSEVTLFVLDPSPRKRADAADRLLGSPRYARNWARYWRDVLASRATETRPQFLLPSLAVFESWIEKQLTANRPWNEIATALITATGDSRADGQTALIVSQRAEPDDMASETARLFLGIQLQCANCHDHPTDRWKREEFHALAAFFPRMQMRPKGEPSMPGTQSLELTSFVPPAGLGGRRFDLMKQIRDNPERYIRRLDKDDDGRLSREEAQQAPGGQATRIFELGDCNRDGFLTAEELHKLPAIPQNMQPGRGAAEYMMSDPRDPHSEGKKLDPVFFLGEQSPGSGRADLDRRQSLAEYVTSPKNRWFAKAFVNRLWGQLVGEGFVMPIDDIGPERTSRHAAAFDELSDRFVASGYDVAWLIRTITLTAAYQRQIMPRDPNQSLPFATAAPSRLRADVLHDTLAQVLGFNEPETPAGDDASSMMMSTMAPMIRANNSFRGQFHQLYGFDPSSLPEEITGTIPQALFLMNSSVLNNLIRAGRQTRLQHVLNNCQNDDDAVTELFLLVHSREPTAKEAEICIHYVQNVGNRQEAFEDLLWTLLNSTEFQMKR